MFELFSVCLRCWFFVCFCICVSLGWSMALFMDQLSDEKTRDTIFRALFHNKKYFIIIFLIINIYFLFNKWYLNTPLLVCLHSLWFDFLINYYFYFISENKKHFKKFLRCPKHNFKCPSDKINFVNLFYYLVYFCYYL